MANGRPKPAFFLVMFAIVAGLIYYGVSRFGGMGGLGGKSADSTGAISPTDLANKGGPEAPDANSVTTVMEDSSVERAKMPEVKGTPASTPPADNSVPLALIIST